MLLPPEASRELRVAVIVKFKPKTVSATSHDSKIGYTKGIQDEMAPALHLSSLCASAAQPGEQQKHRRQYRVGGTKYITIPQATNIIEAVDFAKVIGLPLVAHLTIHWAYTDVGDDPDGKLFAKVREGLDKWLTRRGTCSLGHGALSACRVAKPRWCIAICSSTYPSSIGPKGNCKSRR